MQREDPVYRAMRALRARDWRASLTTDAKNCMRANACIYYAAHAVEIRAKRRALPPEHPKRIAARLRAKKWNNENWERKKLAQTARLARDPEVKLIATCRAAIGAALRQNGHTRAGKTRELLGCTILELKAYLETQFRTGMTWENHGPVWHIDHIRPCSRFNFLDPDQQRQCFNFKNLQPLFVEENLKKGNKWSPN